MNTVLFTIAFANIGLFQLFYIKHYDLNDLSAKHFFSIFIENSKLLKHIEKIIFATVCQNLSTKCIKIQENELSMQITSL